VISSILLGVLLSGSVELTATLGGTTPFGAMELNNRGGISGSVAVGLNQGRNHCELGNELLSLPGNQQPDYTLSIYRVSASYKYAVVNQTEWQLQAGGGIDWNRLTRQLGTIAEHGSVMGVTAAAGYVRSFGHPKFHFELYGSELIDPGQPGGKRTLQDATLIGVRMGVGYEF